MTLAALLAMASWEMTIQLKFDLLRPGQGECERSACYDITTDFAHAKTALDKLQAKTILMMINGFYS